MRRILKIIFPCVLSICLISCKGVKKTSYTNISYTEKDEVMICNNSNYSTTAIVGYGGKLANEELRKIYTEKLNNRENKLQSIEGIELSKSSTDGDKQEFIAVLNNDILFSHNSFDLSPSAVKILTDLSNVINEIPDTQIQILGYTDSTGTEEYNLNLSKHRAEAVGGYLRQLGVENIKEIAKGVSDPIASNKTESGRKQNRRVEIRLINYNI